MAEGHAELYQELAAKYPTRADREQPESPKGERIDFSARPKSGTPLVSVLVPHYNQARFLAECIDSVHAQGYPEIEIVVIDDASTEQGTDAVLSRLEADGDVIVVRLEDNGGPSRAATSAWSGAAGASSSPSTPTTCCCRTRSKSSSSSCLQPEMTSASSIPTSSTSAIARTTTKFRHTTSTRSSTAISATPAR